MKNVKESTFQFTNPTLVGLEYDYSEKFSEEKEKEVTINLDMSVTVGRIKDSNEARVTLTLILGEKSEQVPFYIKAVETAMFKWDDGLNDNVLDKLLRQNAPSLLLSYLRPIITQITAASPVDAYNIPYINFTTN